MSGSNLGVSRVYLRVLSDELPPSALTAAIRLEPTRTREMGSKREPVSRPLPEHRWYLDLGQTSPEVSLTRLLEAVPRLGLEAARRLGELVRAGRAVAMLEVVQVVTDPEDTFQLGIWFENDTLEWLAAAGAGVDIDQYLGF